MYIKELTNNEFDNFAKTYPINSIYQSSSYALVMNNQGFESILLGLFDNNEIIGATMLLIRKHEGFKKAFAPRGFLINYNNFILLENFTNLLKKYLEKLKIISVRLAPIIIKKIYKTNNNNLNNDYDKIMENLKKLGYRHLGYNNNFEALKPRFEAVLDINKSYIELFGNIKKEFRTKIRSADKNGLIVYHGDINQLDILYEQIKNKYPRNINYLRDCYKFFDYNKMIDLYYTKLNTNIFLKNTQQNFNNQEIICENINDKLLKQDTNNNNELINKKIHSDKLLDKYRKQLILATKLLRDYPNGIITSTCLTLKNNSEIFLLMDGYDTNYKNLNSKHLLIWKLIEKYSKLNYKTFNFGGISNDDTVNSKYKGLNEFKLSFNSNIIEYAGDFELITNNTLYFMYKNKGNLKNILKK